MSRLNRSGDGDPPDHYKYQVFLNGQVIDAMAADAVRGHVTVADFDGKRCYDVLKGKTKTLKGSVEIRRRGVKRELPPPPPMPDWGD